MRSSEQEKVRAVNIVSSFLGHKAATANMIRQEGQEAAMANSIRQASMVKALVFLPSAGVEAAKQHLNDCETALQQWAADATLSLDEDYLRQRQSAIAEARELIKTATDGRLSI